MAGAKPSRRGAALTGLHVWLVVFVCLWLVSTVLAVLMFTNQEKLRTAQTQAEAQRNALANSADLATPAIQVLQQSAVASAPPRSLVRLMQDNLRLAASRLTGNPDNDLKAIETQWNGLVDEIAADGKVPNPEQIGRGTGAIPGLRQMYEWFAAEREGKQTALNSLAEANKALEEANARVKTLEDEFKSKLGDMEKKVAGITADKDEFNKVKTQQIDDLDKNISSKKEEISQLNVAMKKQADTQAAEVGKLEKTLAQQADVLATYRTPGPEGTNPLDIARRPIARVLRALPGDSLVHIDLGKLDSVKLGMSFSVYSYDKKVPIDGRGKATLEVVSVGPHTSECRVVTPPPPDDPILEEDFAGNILLSRNKAKKPRFVVVGSFDVDYDGVDDPVGLERVMAFIERFGGEIQPEVDATTDYVIVGRRSAEAPAASTKPDKDQAAVTKARRAAREGAGFDKAVRQAMLLGVPRLRQDPFFNFVGLELGRDVASRLAP